MDNIILGLLMIQKLTIYEINGAFKSGLSLIYSSSYGSIQSAIKKLINKNYITYCEIVENGRNKKIYQINESGKIQFFEWMHSDIPLNKLEDTALSKVFFLGLIEDKESKRKILLNIIRSIEMVQEHLDGMASSLEEITLSEDVQELYGYQMMTLDYGIQAHKNGKEWFQKLLDKL